MVNTSRACSDRCHYKLSWNIVFVVIVLAIYISLQFSSCVDLLQDPGGCMDQFKVLFAFLNNALFPLETAGVRDCRCEPTLLTALGGLSPT